MDSRFGSVLATLLLLGTPTLASAADGAPGSKPLDAPKVVAGPTKEEYRERRRKLMEGLKATEAATAGSRPRAALAPGSAGVVVVMVGVGEPGDDAKFRQENDFWYLTGVDVPHASLILWPESGEETLYLPPLDKAMERWVGPRLGPGSEGVSGSGFARVESSGTFLGDLFRAIGDSRSGGRSSAAVVYLLDPAPRPTSSSLAARLSRFVREGAPSARLKDVALAVHEMRKAKSDAETNLIRRAIAVTGDAQQAVTRMIRPGLAEYQLEGAVLGAFTSGGAARAGFPSIIGSGPNSTVLHYSKNDRVIEAGDLVVVDIGGEYQGYTADITRTYPASGRFTPRQREVYQLVLDAQSAAAAEFKPGVTTMPAMNQLVRDFLHKSPLRARDADGSEQTMDHFFVHGLGHQMGLDVHDVGDNGKPIMPGEVFTIEPGLYLNSEALGVRIEDDYRATKEGVEKLSKDIPVEVDAVERLIEAGRGGSPASSKP